MLLAQDVLHKAARVMASSPMLQQSTAWLTDHPDVQMDRLELGRIHRAQPFSHQYEEGQYHEYFVAHWAHLRWQDQIDEYEGIRETRRALSDVPVRKPLNGEKEDYPNGGTTVGTHPDLGIF